MTITINISDQVLNNVGWFILGGVCVIIGYILYMINLFDKEIYGEEEE